MLVLSRKKNESIVIDENIVVTIVDIRGDKVRLGFTAPNHVKILRSELVGQQERKKTDPPPINVHGRKTKSSAD